MPTESTLHSLPPLHMLDVGDYRTELVIGLSTAWDMARKSIEKVQSKQKFQYDKKAKVPSYKISDRVMVYIPHEATGKDRKLALPYHGPYRIIDIRTNCLLLRSVDKPDEQPILVNMDHVSPCPQEVPDQSWLGPSTHQKRHQRIYSPTTMIQAQPADHHYGTRTRTKYNARGHVP